MTAEFHLLDDIVGVDLAAVTFVRDYLQLQFDPSLVVNVLTPTTVTHGTRRAASGEDGFAAMLVAQVNKTVASVSLQDDQDLTIAFRDRSCIVVSLRPSDYVAAEAISFQRLDGTLVSF